MRPLPKPRRLPLTFWAAVVLLGVAAIASFLWWRWHFFDALAPNVISEAIGIAVTITAIEWILRRQAQERLRPRTDDVLYWMGLDLRMFTSSILTDYAATHIAEIKPIPDDASELIALWIAEHDSEDEPRRTLEGDALPVIVLTAIEFEGNLRRARERDLDVLEPDLVRAIDQFGWHVGQCVQAYGFARDVLSDRREETEATAIGTLMQGTETFAKVFRRYGPEWFKIIDLSVRGALAHREHIVRDRRDASGDPASH